MSRMNSCLEFCIDVNVDIDRDMNVNLVDTRVDALELLFRLHSDVYKKQQ